MGFISKFFEINNEKIGKEHVIGLIGLTLIIFKILFITEFNECIQIFIEGIGQFSFLIKIFELITGIIFILSIITSSMGIIITILYSIVDTINKEAKDIFDRIKLYEPILHSFFVGSKIAVVKINRYFIIALCYFYVMDESKFLLYKEMLADSLEQNPISSVLILTIYSLFLFFASCSLLKLIVYKYLYFESRLEEE